MFGKISVDSTDGDFGRFPIGETELSCRNTAESYGRQTVFLRSFEARAIAGGKQTAILAGRLGFTHYRPDDMDNIFCGKIESGSHYGLTSWFGTSLCLHYFIADKTQLDTSRRMDCIVDTTMKRSETSEES